MTGNTEALDERMEALEVKASYQESTIGELSRQVFEQERRIEQLERAMKEMSKKLKELVEEGLPPLPQNERPPHY